VVDRY
jgi:hypothetical protein